MKKISFLSLHLGFGGIEKSIVAIANLLCDKYDVEIACVYRLYDKPSFEINPKVKVIYLTDTKPNKKELKEAIHKKNPIRFLKEFVKAIHVLRLRKKSMVHYIKHNQSDIVVATRDIFDEWLGKYGKKETLRIGWEHNHYHGDMKYAEKIVKGATHLDYLILVSHHLKEFYQEKLINTHCKCIYIPNILDSLPDELALLTEPHFVSVGRLSKEKGYLDLLKLYTMIHKDNPEWTLDIIGDGPEREILEKYIHNHHLENSVHLHGFQSKDYINQILNQSSIYLMTSYTESFGIVLIEAMSHGLPCVAFTSAEGANEIIQSGQTGYLIENRNFEEYVSKVKILMNDITIRKRMGELGREQIYIYTGSEVLKEWLKVLSE